MIILKIIQKIKRWPWLVIIVSGIALGMLVLYIWHFDNGLSANNSDWGAFGAYFGGIAGLLAFAGVLLTIERTSNYNIINSERDSFFKMLELYTAKFNNVEYHENGKEDKAAEAFKKYTEETNLYLKHVVFYNYIIKSLEEKKNINDLDNLFYGKFEYHENTAPITNIIEKAKKNTVKALKISNEFGWTVTDIISNVKEALKENKIPIIEEGYDISHFVETMLKDRPLSIDDIYDYTRKAADGIYDKYGHILGHYFRNLYYVMKTTSAFRSKDHENYKPLLRAQISRYEIAMNVYNALSSRSGVSMIEYLEDYQILKDLYELDIFLFKLSDDSNLISGLLNKSKEHLRSIKRL